MLKDTLWWVVMGQSHRTTGASAFARTPGPRSGLNTTDPVWLTIHSIPNRSEHPGNQSVTRIRARAAYIM